jgi:ATP-dependent helicase HrpA
MRLSSILRLLPRIDPEAGVLDRAPQGSFSLPEGYGPILERLPQLLRLCRLKRKRKRLGFVALRSDGQGTYWFQPTRNYITALNESLYSLETLADAPEQQAPPSEEVNRLYRELSEQLEEL